MGLADEFKADLSGGELDDLFEPVKWGRHTINAMVQIAGVQEEFTELGGPMFAAVREFSFRRSDLLAIDLDFSTFGERIIYADRKYDVNEVHERPGWPLVTVRATLRS